MATARRLWSSATASRSICQLFSHSPLPAPSSVVTNTWHARYTTPSPRCIFRTWLNSPLKGFTSSARARIHAHTRRTDRRAYYRYHDDHDPRLRNAKPLLGNPTFGDFVRSPSTHTVVILAVGSACIFYFANLETVPVSGRTRFNCYSSETVKAQGLSEYKRVLYEAERQGGKLLPEWDPRKRWVKRVMARLIPFSGLPDDDWEIFVLDEPGTANAFVLPGGKVFVFSGLLRFARNDSGLAAVLGHEIGHNVANHYAERLSQNVGFNFLVWPLVLLGGAVGVGPLLVNWLGMNVLNVVVGNPMSRLQESEADYIGLMMMAEACFDPQEAMRLWERMQRAEKSEVPEWLSTHPSHVSRVQKMNQWMATALEKRAASDCRSTTAFAHQFRSALQRGSIIFV